MALTSQTATRLPMTASPYRANPCGLRFRWISCSVDCGCPLLVIGIWRHRTSRSSDRDDGADNTKRQLTHQRSMSVWVPSATEIVG